jgi:hypothetical protein
MPVTTADAMAMQLTTSPQVKGLSTGALSGPDPLSAAWLGAIERRIRDSIVPAERAAENDGRWLSPEVANTAIQFFRQASGVLPGEPYIYSSGSGDLIAEFKTRHGLLTSVVTLDKVLAVAMVDGQPRQITINLETATGGILRRQLQPITDLLNK